MHNEITAPQNNIPATMQGRMEALRHRVKQESVEVWQPEPGDTLCGVYTGHQQIEHPRYGAQWQLFLKDESGNTYAVWMNQWLRHNLKAQNLELGDIVAISFIGKKRTAGGTEYNAYSLALDKA